MGKASFGRGDSLYYTAYRDTNRASKKKGGSHGQIETAFSLLFCPVDMSTRRSKADLEYRRPETRRDFIYLLSPFRLYFKFG